MSYNIFTAGVVVLGVAVLVCGLPMCCYDTYMKSQEQKRREEDNNKKYDYWDDDDGKHYGSKPNMELPEKILEFKTAMKDINLNV